MNYTTINTQYIVYDEDNSECNVFEFTVSANTDVGNSGLSEKTVKGFPKSKTKYEYQLSTTFCSQRMRLRLFCI